MPLLCEQQLLRLRSLQDEQYLCLSRLEQYDNKLQTMSDAVCCCSFCFQILFSVLVQILLSATYGHRTPKFHASDHRLHMATHLTTCPN